jgi:regulatory protein
MPFRKKQDKKENQNADPVLILEKIRYFCSYRERSEKEAEIKLRLMKVPPAKINGILNQLREEGFISDERFARSFIRGKWKINQWGRIKISFELRSRSIPEKFITKALEEIDEETYRELLKGMIRKKAGEIRVKTEKSGVLTHIQDSPGKKNGVKTIRNAAKTRKDAFETGHTVQKENISKKTLNIRDKIFNFALGKGYEPDLIYEILHELKI